jgi:pimeloyl-ACP methyl ester carboxylesterase
MVYLHGLGSDWNGEKARFLEERVAAIGFGTARFDFRGHGRSSGTLAEMTLSELLLDVDRVVAALARGELGAVPAGLVLVGSSLGGLVSAWYCAREPDRIGAQVLIAPAFRIVERFLDTLPETQRRDWQDRGRHRFEGPWLDFELSWELVEDSRRYAHEALLRDTRIPTWILHGTRDESVPHDLSLDFARTCRGTRPTLITIADGDHRLTDAVERIFETVRDALEEIDDERPR